MRKKEKSLIAILPSAKIYLGDVEVILQTFGEICKRVKISDNEFVYESLDEVIGKRGRSVKRLELAGYDPHISIKFDRSDLIVSTRLYTSSENVNAEAGFHRIKQLLLE